LYFMEQTEYAPVDNRTLLASSSFLMKRLLYILLFLSVAIQGTTMMFHIVVNDMDWMIWCGFIPLVIYSSGLYALRFPKQKYLTGYILASFFAIFFFWAN